METLLAGRDAVEDHIVTGVLLPFRDEIARRREHEARVKEKYGLRSLDYLIQESNQKLLDYQLRQAAGEQMEMPLLNERRNLEQLEQRRRDLEREIRLERNLTVSEPRIIGAAAVLPLAVPEPEAETLVYEPVTPQPVIINDERAQYQVGAGMRRDDEIEAVGMRVAMTYERERGWVPEDVSGENHGFDVRSTCYDDDGTPSAGPWSSGPGTEGSGQAFADVRYIEVKARARSGAIRLSANEWKKARHFGDKFWLYIVTQAAADAPQLQHIRDPAAHFCMDESIFATGFIIPEENWQERTTNSQGK